VGRMGHFVFLGFRLALTLGGCYGFTRDVRPYVVPYVLWWVGIAVFAIVNRRLRVLRWPAEFFFWGTSFLIILQLYWLVNHVNAG
jgi:hypothetical protein